MLWMWKCKTQIQLRGNHKKWVVCGGMLSRACAWIMDRAGEDSKGLIVTPCCRLDLNIIQLVIQNLCSCAFKSSNLQTHFPRPIIMYLATRATTSGSSAANPVLMLLTWMCRSQSSKNWGQTESVTRIWSSLLIFSLLFCVVGRVFIVCHSSTRLSVAGGSRYRWFRHPHGQSTCMCTLFFVFNV